VKKILLMTVGGLVVYMAMSFLLAKVLKLTGSNYWIALIVLLIVGLIAAAVIVWIFSRMEKASSGAPANAGAPGGADAPGGSGEIDLMIREAEAKLAAAKLPPLGSTPVILVIGDPGSTKTSTIVHSGLEPELLAGQVYQETAIVPTRSTNLWLAGRIVIVEAGGALLDDAAKWTRLVKRMQPGKLRSLTGQGGQAPRAALLCFDTENFTKAGAAEAAVTAARKLRQRLGEISANLGINIPVYVIFTRMDRVQFFFEYVRNLSDEEAQQVVGASLPMPSGGRATYVEQETARLNNAFDRLFRSLCDARPEFLSREHDASQLPGTYEFPREFRKLRPALVQFLLELCRPSQLAVGPFLRGFYFSGIRPVTINEAAPTPRQQAASGSGESAIAATGILRVGGAAAQQRPAAVGVPGGSSRRVPQWVFLPQLFRKVLLEDKVAMGASSSSTKASLLKRVLLASAAALCLIFGILFIVSFAQNHSLESDVQQAALGATTGVTTGTNLASVEDLRRLESLRQTLQVLTTYNREGPPLSYRWGLYTGDSLYPSAYKLYFIRFKQLLFGQTQNGLADDLSRLPALPGPSTPDYGSTYNILKAYLITTTNHDKSTRSFLAPLLLNRWSMRRNVDVDRMQLAQRQFEFYSDELQVANPYSSTNDAQAVKTGRGYLAQFMGFERVYQAMRDNAAKAGMTINFNKQFPRTIDIVSDPQDVPGEFSKPGFDFMKAAMQNPERYFAGEPWVLGDQGPVNIDRASLAQQLQMRYYSDFGNAWRAYFKAGSVLKYKDLKDGAQKLTVLSGPTSPLLALLCLASQNTAVDAPQVSAAFQPPQAVVPAPCLNYVNPANQDYVTALVTLQASLQTVADQPQPSDAALSQTLETANKARITANTLRTKFSTASHIDVQTKVLSLLMDPITNAEALLRNVGPDELNAGGAGFCATMNKVWAKYPFKPDSTVDATVADVSGIFRKPDGALWTFYNATLQKVLIRQGSNYVASPNGGVTAAFVSFFNQAAAFSDSLYPANAQDPGFDYTLKPLPGDGAPIPINLDVDGQKLAYSGTGNAMPQKFSWRGASANELSATVTIDRANKEWGTASGRWAIFHFLGSADHTLPSDTGQTAVWIVKTTIGKANLGGKAGDTVKLQVESPIFSKDYFVRMRCVATVARP
jgi:type VI secretion system protein ImpL